MVFALLVLALRLSSDEVTKRGIFSDLGNAFDFSGLNDIQSREEFVTHGLPSLSAKSKEYFTLSSRYFQPDGMGSMMLLRDISLLTTPKPGPRVTLSTPSFSFSAWVRTRPQFSSGFIVRKTAQEGSDLSCWGWHLSAGRGPALYYGSHDFFLTHNSLPPSQDRPRQMEVELEPPVPMEPDSFMMLSIIVTPHRVTFYQDRREVGSRELPRKVTDCFNNGGGTLLGGPSMEVGVVRYFPFPLTESSIEELFSTGGILADISTGSDPEIPEESELAVAERALAASISAVDAAVHHRQPLSELSMMLKIVQDSAPPEVTSPPAPTGAIFVNASASLRVDALNSNRSYSLLFQGPWRLTETEGPEEEHRRLVGVPSFSGTGATLMFWYKHMPCKEAFCGIFLFTGRRGGDARLCWSLWTEDNGIWFDNLLGTPRFQYPKNIVADKFKLQENAWRHLAMVFDETSDMVRWYMDGELAVTLPWGSAVSNADCAPGPDNFVTLGRNYPGYTYGAEVELYDLRLYVHPNGSPMQGAEVKRVAQGPTPGLSELQRCLPVTSPVMQDSDWTDTFGHDCGWYYDQRQTNPAVCRLEAAAQQCPIACKSRQECLSSEESPEVFFSWDRIRKIEARGENGTICLHDQDSADAAVERCMAWVASGNARSEPLDPLLQPWLQSFQEAKGRRIELRDCTALREAIDPYCSFNASAVKAFTAGVMRQNGDFTIGFWVKPTAAASLIDGKFIPHVQFYASLSPPTHNLAWGLWLNANGEARLFSSCARGDRDIFENIEMNAASEGEWTFLAFTRFNSTSTTNSSVTTNLGRNIEGSTLPVCLYDDDALFSALEFNYDVLVSPLMMVPGALPFAAVQELYLTNAKDMLSQTGPLVSSAVREEQPRIQLNKQDFQPRSVLTAPPIVFQTRVEPSRSCPFNYASDFISAVHGKARDSKCAVPYLCSEEVLEDPAMTMACPGGAKREGTVFGLAPNKFNSMIGYADFLYSITDNSFLFREGQVMPTSTFITSLTESVSVTLVFFTPKYGITSLMTLSAEFHGAAAAEVSVALEHFEILEGSKLYFYLFVQSIVLVSIAIMILDIIASLVWAFRHREDQDNFLQIVIKQLIDTSTCVMVVVFVAYRIPSKMNSASDTTKLVGGLSEIPWDSLEVPLEQKKEDFFNLVVELTGLIGTEADLSTFCNIILIVSLLRVIQCTALHPRLALLTGTLHKATDDLVHAALLIGLLMGCFAGIATWRFGSEIAAFGTFSLTMQTQFEMLFGEFPDGWNESTDLMVYTILYIIILFLLVQNFLLAIVVEAYMKVREENEVQKTQDGFVPDVINSTGAYIKGKLKGWPSPSVLEAHVASWTSKISVGMRELYITGEFRSMESVGQFLDYYSGFEFLKPTPVKDFYFFKEPEHADVVAHRVMVLLGRQPTLRVEAERAFDTVARRKRARHDHAKHPSKARHASTPAAAAPARTEPASEFFSPRIGTRNGHEGHGDDEASESEVLLSQVTAMDSSPEKGAARSEAVQAMDLQAAGAPSAGLNIWRMREEMEKRLTASADELLAVRTELHGLNRRLEDQTRRAEHHFHQLMCAISKDDPNPKPAPHAEPSIPPPYPYGGRAGSLSPTPASNDSWGRRLRSFILSDDLVGTSRVSPPAPTASQNRGPI